MKPIRSFLALVALACAYGLFAVGFVLDRVADALDGYEQEPFR